VVNRPDPPDLIDGYIPKEKDGYMGAGVRPEQIVQHKERWDKVEKILT
jgi:hypothetical protein